jgi:hypothetical protein
MKLKKNQLKKGKKKSNGLTRKIHNPSHEIETTS